MTYVLALDQGTTSSRAILFDAEGRPQGTARRDVPQHYPRPGWVEHDPEIIWRTQREAAEEVLLAAGLVPSDVAAIGITNQRETVVVWDRATGEPIHHAIVWQDRRTAATCERLIADGAETLVREKTGLVIDPYFSALEIAWILDHVDGARAGAASGRLAAGTIDTWLLHRLTGGRVHATDASNASRTSLYDIRAGCWDEELLRLFDVPVEVLPEVCSSSEVYAEASELLPGVPVAGIAGDQQAALFGQACFEPGQAKNTYGTGCFLVRNTGDQPIPSAARLLATVAWRIGEQTTYALEGSVFMGGATVAWLRDGLGLVDDVSEVETLAASVDDTGGVVFVPALAGLGAPHWDPHARGLLIGMTRGTTRAHVARAALEAIAFQVADVADAMRTDTGSDLGEMRVDGGASANDLLLGIQADVAGVPVERPRVQETTALGAAFLAGLAVGVWRGKAELAATWALDRRFEPRADAVAVARRRARWSEAVSRARDWARHADEDPARETS